MKKIKKKRLFEKLEYTNVNKTKRKINLICFYSPYNNTIKIIIGNIIFQNMWKIFLQTKQTIKKHQQKYSKNELQLQG